MSEERRKILEMLSQGKISVDEAEKLLAVLSAPEPEENEARSAKLRTKYVRIVVEPGPFYLDKIARRLRASSTSGRPGSAFFQRSRNFR